MTNAHQLNGSGELGPESHPGVATAAVDPSITGGAVLRSVESGDLTYGLTAEDLAPHETLGMKHLQHARVIVRAVNGELSADEAPFRLGDNPVTRITNYLGQRVTLRRPGTEPQITTRRSLTKVDQLIYQVLQELTDRDPLDQTPNVIARYIDVAGGMTDKDGERLFSDGYIHASVIDALAMMHEGIVHDEVAEQVEAAKFGYRQEQSQS